MTATEEKTIIKQISSDPSKVDVTRLYEELHAFWKTMHVSDEESEGVTRACLHNLIAYTERQDIYESFNQPIVDITQLYPCRAIVIHAEPGNPVSSIEAWISAHCHLQTSTAKQICCEQITIHATGNDVQQIPSLVVPLLVADLPTTLWWREDGGFDTKLFLQLADASDEILVQSNDYENPNQVFTEIDRLSANPDFHTPVIDLAWQRIQVWREIIAYLFDKPEFREDVHHIQNIKLEFNGEQKNLNTTMPPEVYPNKVYLMISWLASRLQWSVELKTQDMSKDTFHAKTPDGRKVPIEVQRIHDEEIPLKQLIKLEIVTGKDNESKKFCIHLVNHCTHLLIQVESGGKFLYSRTQVMKLPSDADYVGARLQAIVQDKVFEKSLQSAIRLTVL
jgi:hypothetical protein